MVIVHPDNIDTGCTAILIFKGCLYHNIDKHCTHLITLIKVEHP